MEEKLQDKYQESVEDKSVVQEKELPPDSQSSQETEQKVLTPETKKEALGSPEKLNSQEKLLEKITEETEPKKDLSPEALAKDEEPVEAVKPGGLANDSPSKTPTEEDKALRAKKIEEIKKLSQEKQIKALCNLAFEKDIDFAAEIAKGLNDAYVLDEFHDKLDKLNLIKKGKLKEI